MWFAWKIVPLWYQQQLLVIGIIGVICCDLLEKSYLCGINNNQVQLMKFCKVVVICLKNRTFVVSTTTMFEDKDRNMRLWFAWKIVPLWYQQQPKLDDWFSTMCCDLLEKSYLCGINNNSSPWQNDEFALWFAWKIVPLWYQQQHIFYKLQAAPGCDLLEKSYLCGINNNKLLICNCLFKLWFAWKIVPLWYQQQLNALSLPASFSCDLLEKSYLCGINNNCIRKHSHARTVVICLKNRTFVVSTTTSFIQKNRNFRLWFAWKIVPLWYQQQRCYTKDSCKQCCDLLEKSYLCGINNNRTLAGSTPWAVVICLKNRTFVVSTTTNCKKI